MTRGLRATGILSLPLIDLVAQSSSSMLPGVLMTISGVGRVGRHPIVYRLFDADGELLWVGVTKDLGRRLQRHRDSKPWWDDVAKLTVERFPTYDEATAGEARALQTEWPRYNVTGIPFIGPIRPSHWGRTHCGRGHALTESNLVFARNGSRRCRICAGATERKRDKGKIRERKQAKWRAERLAAGLLAIPVQCQATSTKTGQRCRRVTLFPSELCRHHGGVQ